MTKKIAKNCLAFLCVLALICTVFAGCTTNGEKKQDTKQGTQQSTQQSAAFKKEDMNDIRIMVPYFATEPPQKDNRLEKYLEEYTGVKFDIEWVAGSLYTEKINIKLASSDLPDVFRIRPMNLKQENILNAAKANQFWDISDKFKNYSNLVKVHNKELIYNLSIDGKLYGIPTTRAWVSACVLYRKDWADNLGLKEPKNIEDIYNMALAFKTKDPDKNGKADTEGIVENKTFNENTYTCGSLPFLAVVHGAPNEWGEKDGKLQPSFMFNEFLDTLKFYRRLVKDGLMNKDFAALNKLDAFDRLAAGKAGMMIFNLYESNGWGGKTADFYNINPKGEVAVATNIEGPKGFRMNGVPGHDGIFLLPKSAIKTEGRMAYILQAYDKLAQFDMEMLKAANDADKAKLMTFMFGYEGDTYKKVDGKIQRDDTKYRNDIDPFHQIMPDNMYLGTLTGNENTLKVMREKAFEKILSDPKLPVYNPAVPFTTDTLLKKGTQLNNAINDSMLKFILSEIDENGWKNEIEKWKQLGGDKLIEEFSAEYAKTKK